jgi:hypothetical protein
MSRVRRKGIRAHHHAGRELAGGIAQCRVGLAPACRGGSDTAEQQHFWCMSRARPPRDHELGEAAGDVDHDRLAARLPKHRDAAAHGFGRAARATASGGLSLGDQQRRRLAVGRFGRKPLPPQVRGLTILPFVELFWPPSPALYPSASDSFGAHRSSWPPLPSRPTRRRGPHSAPSVRASVSERGLKDPRSHRPRSRSRAPPQ